MPDDTWIIGTVFLFGSGVCAIYAIYRFAWYQRTESWPTANGRVLRSEVVKTRNPGGHSTIYEARVAYEYEVYGQRYESDTIALGGDIWTSARGRADQVSARYPVDATVLVRYNPDKPGKSGLERSSRTLMVGVAGTFILAGLGVFLRSG